jgi:ABC-type uncharacterized transport system ATPase subunit
MITGFLDPDGAGKTMSMRMILGLEHNALRKPGLQHPDSQAPGSREIRYSGLASHSGRIASMLSS